VTVVPVLIPDKRPLSRIAEISNAVQPESLAPVIPINASFQRPDTTPIPSFSERCRSHGWSWGTRKAPAFSSAWSTDLIPFSNRVRMVHNDLGQVAA